MGRIAKSLKGGQIFAIYLMWYALGRSWIEALRVNYSTYILGIRINVWAAFLVFILGAIMFVLLAQHGRSRKVLAAQVVALTKRTAEKEQARVNKSTDILENALGSDEENLQPASPEQRHHTDDDTSADSSSDTANDES